MEPNVIIPAPGGDYVELAGAKGYTGRHWRKHILNLGELIHPKTGERLQLDDNFYSHLVSNFEAGVSEVAVPLADDRNRHSEDPLRNAGEVMGITREGNKVFVDLDIRNADVNKGLEDKTILGASAFLNLDYEDTRTGRKVGPTLLHSCITNRPYVTGLDGYEEVLAATMADSEGDYVVLAEEDDGMPLTREEMLAALKADHNIDVEALQAAVSEKADLSQLTAALTAALGKGDVQLTPSGDDGGVTLPDAVAAVAELAQSHVELTGEVKSLKRTNAEREVDGYVKDGRVMPKQRDSFVKLAMEDRPMFEDMLPAEPVVKLNAQEGGAPPQGEQKHEFDLDAELNRLSSQKETSQFFTPNGATRKS